uniref:Uncharacterized protein n=1 Tax=Ciona savignyi TaxID=51511 RepID=H2Y5D0_CIOSA
WKHLSSVINNFTDCWPIIITVLKGIQTDGKVNRDFPSGAICHYRFSQPSSSSYAVGRRYVDLLQRKKFVSHSVSHVMTANFSKTEIQLTFCCPGMRANSSKTEIQLTFCCPEMRANSSKTEIQLTLCCPEMRANSSKTEIQENHN